MKFFLKRRAGSSSAIVDFGNCTFFFFRGAQAKSWFSVLARSMLFMKMDLLNYQYLDNMNNNIGILCYEGRDRPF